MKIHGPNSANFNAYKKQMNAQENRKNTQARKDQLEISPQAKKMQGSGKPQLERTAYVEKIKKAYESGNYQIDHAKTAQKMVDFWSK